MILSHALRTINGKYEFSFINSYNSTSDLTTYTFNSVDFGVTNPKREIFIQIIGTTSTTRSVSSVTIGGINATLSTSSPSSGTSAQRIAFATVPTESTGSVVVTFSGGCTACYISVYRVINRPNIGSNETDYNTAPAGAIGTSSSLSNVTTNANGFFIGNILIIGSPTNVSSNTYTLEGGATIESNYRGSLSLSRIGQASTTPTNTVTWTTSLSFRQTGWSFH
jgi:hypothetical protein